MSRHLNHGKGRGNNPLGYTETSREYRRRIAFGKGNGASLPFNMLVQLRAALNVQGRWK